MKPLTSGVCFAIHEEQEAISLKCVLQGAVMKPLLASFRNPAPSESRKIFPFDYQKIKGGFGNAKHGPGNKFLCPCSLDPAFSLEEYSACSLG